MDTIENKNSQQAKGGSEVANLEVGKYYTITYKYKGREFEEFACYKQFDFGKHYFKQDNGEWLILKPSDIINIKPQNQKS